MRHSDDFQSGPNNPRGELLSRLLRHVFMNQLRWLSVPSPPLGARPGAELLLDARVARSKRPPRVRAVLTPHRTPRREQRAWEFHIPWLKREPFPLKAQLWFHDDTTQRGGLRMRHVVTDPPCVQREGFDVRLPQIETLRRGDAAARAVIGQKNLFTAA